MLPILGTNASDAVRSLYADAELPAEEPIVPADFECDDMSLAATYRPVY